MGIRVAPDTGGGGGVFVLEVAPNSIAAGKGIHAGDHLLLMNAEKINSFEHYRARAAATPV